MNTRSSNDFLNIRDLSQVNIVEFNQDDYPGTKSDNRQAIQSTSPNAANKPPTSPNAESLRKNNLKKIRKSKNMKFESKSPNKNIDP